MTRKRPGKVAVELTEAELNALMPALGRYDKAIYDDPYVRLTANEVGSFRRAARKLIDARGRFPMVVVAR